MCGSLCLSFVEIVSVSLSTIPLLPFRCLSIFSLSRSVTATAVLIRSVSANLLKSLELQCVCFIGSLNVIPMEKARKEGRDDDDEEN